MTPALQPRGKSVSATPSIWRKLKLPWHDYLAAMKRAIEREIGCWQNRGTLLPTGEQKVVHVTVRDEDFTIR
jgi:hypothetical protein